MSLPVGLISDIMKYLGTTKLKFDKKHISYEFLSLNSHETAADMLLENADRIAVAYAYSNPNTRITKHVISTASNIGTYCMCDNNNDISVEHMISILSISPPTPPAPSFSRNNNDKAVDYLLANPHHINWELFSGNNNDKAVDYLLTNPQYISWELFSRNNNDKAVKHLLANPHHIYWENLSMNDNDMAADYLLTRVGSELLYESKIDWENISLNYNTKVLRYLIDERPDKIILDYFTGILNPIAVDYVLQQPDDTTNWENLSINEHIFERDESIYETLMQLKI